MMEREGKLDPALIRAAFDMGLMAVEVPEEHGGSAGREVERDPGPRRRGKGDDRAGFTARADEAGQSAAPR